MATRKPAKINDDVESFFEEPAPPARPALVRMERDAKYGPPLTADVHPSEVERRQARGWRRA